MLALIGQILLRTMAKRGKCCASRTKLRRGFYTFIQLKLINLLRTELWHACPTEKKKNDQNI